MLESIPLSLAKDRKIPWMDGQSITEWQWFTTHINQCPKSFETNGGQCLCVCGGDVESETAVCAVINDPHRSHISSALFNTLIILHLLGKLDFYETRSSVFEFNWNAVTSGRNMRRGTCYSIHSTVLNLWHTKALKHCVRKSRVPFVGHPSIKILEMSKDA